MLNSAALQIQYNSQSDQFSGHEFRGGSKKEKNTYTHSQSLMFTGITTQITKSAHNSCVCFKGREEFRRILVLGLFAKTQRGQ